MKVIQFPLTRITIGFVIGIAGAHYLQPEPKIVFITLFITFLTLMITYFLAKRKNANTIYFGIITYLLAISIGGTSQIIHTNSYQKSNYIHRKAIFDKSHLVSVTVKEKLKSSNYNDRYIVLVNHIDQAKNSGRILLNVQKDNLNSPFEIGTH